MTFEISSKMQLLTVNIISRAATSLQNLEKCGNLTVVSDKVGESGKKSRGKYILPMGVLT